MILEHKIFVLTDANRKDAQVDSAKDLILVVNDAHAGPVIPQPASELDDLIQEADMLEDNILEGYSILGSFAVKDGELRYDNIRVRFYDIVKKADIFISQVKRPPLLMEKVGTIDLDDTEVKRQMAFLSQYLSAETPEQSPAELADDIEPVNEPQETPVTEEPLLVKEEETPTAEVDNSVTENKEAGLSVSQLEENTIPQAVLDKYEEYRKDLVEKDGYKEYIYKNYRFFEMPSDDPDKRGMDVLLLILTPERVAQIRPLQMVDSDNILKYKFEMNGVKKTLTANTETSELLVKRFKRGEKLVDAPQVNEEPVEETAPLEPAEETENTEVTTEGEKSAETTETPDA